MWEPWLSFDPVAAASQVTAPKAWDRTARAMLGWSQSQLAEAAGVSRATVVDFERGLRIPHRNNLT
ncbi:MAG: helix-turn-helix transcriptional regulator, partial [Xanthobacteraceae bacterium]